MDKSEMKKRLLELAPFHHNIGLPYGLCTHIPSLANRPVEKTRVSSLLNHAFPPLLEACGGSLQGKRILDVGCNCGGFSVEAIEHGASYVLGIDSVDFYIKQACFVKEALELHQAHFKKMTAEEVDSSTVGDFDITFCFGVLYHFENPVMTMKKLASVTRGMMVIDTNILTLPDSFSRQHFLWKMDVLPDIGKTPGAFTTGQWRTEDVVQFTPTVQAVEKLLHFLGFSNVRELEPVSKNVEDRYRKGTRKTFLASRE